ncbi:hypothetical protein S245_004539, partial [Arachis hypogaea]
ISYHYIPSNLKRCSEIESFPEGGLPPNLKMLDIRSCKKLVTYLASMDLRDHCLTHLDIEHPYDNINSFPMDGCLPSSLETLYLRCFPSLEILDCKGIYHLQELLIDHCPNLQDVAGKSFPASLSILKLYGDSLLKKCWQMKDPLILKYNCFFCPSSSTVLLDFIETILIFNQSSLNFPVQPWA